MMVDFLANNYIWFLVISIILFFALIGYIVDTKEQKKWSAYGTVSKEMEQNFQELAAAAQNQTMNQIMQNNVSIVNQNNIMNQGEANSSLNNQMSMNSMTMPNLNTNNENHPSFEVLGK